MNNGHTASSQSSETREDFSGRMQAGRPNQPYVPEGGYPWNAGNEMPDNMTYQTGQVNQINQMNQMNQMSQVSQMNQMSQVSQMSQLSQMNQMNQMAQMNQMTQMDNRTSQINQVNGMADFVPQQNPMDGVKNQQGIGNSAMNSMAPNGQMMSSMMPGGSPMGSMMPNGSPMNLVMPGDLPMNLTMPGELNPPNAPEVGPLVMEQSPFQGRENRPKDDEKLQEDAPRHEVARQSVNKSAEMLTPSVNIEEESSGEIRKLEGKAMRLITKARSGMPADQFYKAVQDARDEAIGKEVAK